MAANALGKIGSEKTVELLKAVLSEEEEEKEVRCLVL